MPKPKTLRERAAQYLLRSYKKGTLAADVEKLACELDFMAGYRANRLTKAERAVVEAAIKWSRHCSLDNSATLHHAAKLVDVERDKGRK
jgi:hypothetical protein